MQELLLKSKKDDHLCGSSKCPINPCEQALTHFVDRMIVLAKRGDDLSRREAGVDIPDVEKALAVGVVGVGVGVRVSDAKSLKPGITLHRKSYTEQRKS